MNGLNVITFSHEIIMKLLAEENMSSELKEQLLKLCVAKNKDQNIKAPKVEDVYKMSEVLSGTQEK